MTETYDKRLRLTDVGAGTGVGTSFSYDDADRRTALTRDNGVTGTISFNLNDWITAITHSHASPPTWTSALEYGYDPVGNRIYASNSLQADRSEVYTYDQRHRLLGFTRGTITSWTTSSWGASIPNAVTALPHATIPGGQTWGLDKRGNWGSFSEMLGTPTLAAIPQTRTFNGVNEVQAIDPDAGGPASSVSLYHDAKGKLTHDPFAPNYGGSIAPGQQYEYDAENRLISVTTDDITPGSKQMTHHAPAAAA